MLHVKYLGNRRGFTLIELLIVTAIIGIMAGVMAYGFERQLPKYRLNGATRQVAWDLMEARTQGIRYNRSVTLTIPNDSVYTIWIDKNSDDVVDPGEEKQKDLHDDHHDVSFVMGSLVVTNPLFTSRGTSSAISNITLINPSGSKNISIDISGVVDSD